MTDRSSDKTRALRVAVARRYLGLGKQLPADRTPDEVFAVVEDYFRQAVETGDPSPWVVAALRTILQEAPCGIGNASAIAFDYLEAAVEPAFRRMLGCSPHDVIGDELGLGFASVRDLLRLTRDPNKRVDEERFELALTAYLDAIALLADVLDASLRRERLSSWMTANAHSYAIWQALKRDDALGLPLH